MILITGSSGQVGQATLRHLRPTDAIVRCADRDASPGEPDSVRFDFLDPDTFEAALAGVDVVLLIRPPQLAKPRQDMLPFLMACKRDGIRRVVFLSLQGADRNGFTPHAKIEGLIRECGLDFTFLRPSFFMQNLTGTHRAEIRDEQRIMVPAGQGRTNFIDVDDIGAVAARVLIEDGHTNRAYELTGSDSWTYAEVADRLSRTTGRLIRYERPGVFRFLAHHLRKGTPFRFALVMAAIYTIARLGRASGTTDTVRQLLGRPPRSLPDFIEEHRDLWLT
ncbi:SDR family oxidoreductase [Saccharospirillum salsuginis]|uniref:NAD(P)-dependent oxidoreductase n=1 Tax=Saccharospirillum salsuginis TaxID=418750 RepID=A0A918KL16_9GAMM|nr:SDR family oxidoreductase [Saccharospirillum salsuginis]GGX67814.1 NAD(P)-dependent oxidoreductase [Saccharospirillum salsuginis]